MIGNILPGTYGNRVAQLVLNIDQQLNEAQYFAMLYDGESKTEAHHTYEAQQFGLSVVRLLELLEGISPDDESMDASHFRALAKK